MFTLQTIVKAWGYKDTTHFIDSAFHPNFTIQAAAVSGTFATFAYYFDKVFGFQLPVGLVIIALFAMEMRTGIMASKRNGVGWKSDKYQMGWLKFIMYWIMCGCTNILDIYAAPPHIFGYNIDIYAFIHFAWYNFVILQMLGSTLENFIKLGWDKRSMIIRILIKLYNIHLKKNENDKAL